MTKTIGVNDEQSMSFVAEKALKDEASVSTQKTGKSYTHKAMTIKFEMSVSNPSLSMDIRPCHVEVLLAMLHSFVDSLNIFDKKSRKINIQTLCHCNSSTTYSHHFDVHSITSPEGTTKMGKLLFVIKFTPKYH